MWLKETEKLLLELSGYKEIEGFIFTGGSALSYYLKHRFSEDLDFFYSASSNMLDKKNIRKLIDKLSNKNYKIINALDEEEQLDFYIDNVKITFCAYSKFGHLLHENNKILFGNIKIAELDVLTAMKVDALIGREKIRDYYDLYAISMKCGFKKMIDDSLNADSNFNTKLFIKRLIEMDDKLKDIYIDDYLKPKYSIDRVSIRIYFEEQVDNYISANYIKSIK